MEEPIDLRPYLVCLNLQQTSDADVCDALGAVLWRARSCLHWARAAAIPVVHVHTLRIGEVWSPPIPGFEPLHTEVVIVKPAGAPFKESEWGRSGAAMGRRFLLVGLSLNLDALEAALAGGERQTRIVLIRDALGMENTRLPPDESALDRARQLLGACAAAADTRDLITRYGRARHGF
jgi:hypothetical protein